MLAGLKLQGRMQSSGMIQVTLASGRTTEETGHVRIENVFLFFYFSINFI